MKKIILLASFLSVLCGSIFLYSFTTQNEDYPPSCQIAGNVEYKVDAGFAMFCNHNEYAVDVYYKLCGNNEHIWLSAGSSSNTTFKKGAYCTGAKSLDGYPTISACK